MNTAEAKPKRQLVRGKLYRVRADHPFWPGRVGVFQFWGGPAADVIVLAQRDNGQVLFCVGSDDLTLDVR